jgi:hypothetical protein
MLSRKVFRTRLALSDKKYASYKQAVDTRSVSPFAIAAQWRPGALLVAPDALFDSRREQLVTLAKSHAIPTIYDNREFVAASGLMSYGSFAEQWQSDDGWS